uniref:Putative PD-(D/E)XK nuclease superfamily protein n=2 Tax=viral metagenome TaxID=1070528 RepID=A0A6M3L097_9ZZZZ
MAHPKGGYKTKDGKKAPGTTTIIGRFKDSGGLLYWACEQGKAIERGEISKLYDKRDEAADAGTLAHLMVEAYINDEKFDVGKYPQNIIAQAQQGFDNYLTWAENNRMVIVNQEMELVSEKYQYGGCPDAIAYDAQERLCLLDWKTSNGVYVDYLIQLAAYRQLWEENNPDDPITGGFHLCRFSKEHADFTHHYWSELDDAWEQFLLFRAAYDLDKKLKKRV